MGRNSWEIWGREKIPEWGNYGEKGVNFTEQEAIESETESLGSPPRLPPKGNPLQRDHNGQTSETTQLSITGRLGKETRAH